MRLTNVGSQYLLANVDADGEPFDGAKTYRVSCRRTSRRRFWSLSGRRAVQRREDLPADGCPRTSRPPGSGRSPSTTTRPAPCCRPPQRYPRAGSQMFPSPAAEARGRRLHRRLLLPDPARRSRGRATGSRPTPTRAGSSSCACTAHSSPSSTRPGDPAKSNPWRRRTSFAGRKVGSQVRLMLIAAAAAGWGPGQDPCGSSKLASVALRDRDG